MIFFKNSWIFFVVFTATLHLVSGEPHLNETITGIKGLSTFFHFMVASLGYQRFDDDGVTVFAPTDDTFKYSLNTSDSDFKDKYEMHDYIMRFVVQSDYGFYDTNAVDTSPYAVDIDFGRVLPLKNYNNKAIFFSKRIKHHGYPFDVYYLDGFPLVKSLSNIVAGKRKTQRLHVIHDTVRKWKRVDASFKVVLERKGGYGDILSALSLKGVHSSDGVLARECLEPGGSVRKFSTMFFPKKSTLKDPALKFFYGEVRNKPEKATSFFRSAVAVYNLFYLTWARTFFTYPLRFGRMEPWTATVYKTNKFSYIYLRGVVSWITSGPTLINFGLAYYVSWPLDAVQLHKYTISRVVPSFYDLCKKYPSCMEKMDAKGVTVFVPLRFNESGELLTNNTEDALNLHIIEMTTILSQKRYPTTLYMNKKSGEVEITKSGNSYTVKGFLHGKKSEYNVVTPVIYPDGKSIHANLHYIDLPVGFMRKTIAQYIKSTRKYSILADYLRDFDVDLDASAKEFTVFAFNDRAWRELKDYFGRELQHYKRIRNQFMKAFILPKKLRLSTVSLPALILEKSMIGDGHVLTIKVDYKYADFVYTTISPDSTSSVEIKAAETEVELVNGFVYELHKVPFRGTVATSFEFNVDFVKPQNYRY